MTTNEAKNTAPRELPLDRGWWTDLQARFPESSAEKLSEMISADLELLEEQFKGLVTAHTICSNRRSS